MAKVVAHLITGLGKGGAETMLYQVLKYRSDAELKYYVVSMGGASYFEEPIKKLGIEVRTFNFKKHPFSSLIQLVGYLRKIKAEILCCWMYHANFFGYLASKIVGIKNVVWNIRHSDLSGELNRGLTLKINRICVRWSRKVSCITYNGEKARAIHEAVGYCRNNGFVLDNGVDTEIYKPIPEAAKAIRTELNLSAEQRIVLSVSRYHPIKDTSTFLKAFADVHHKMPETVAVMCGACVDTNNSELVGLCRELDLIIGKDVFLLGMRHDIPELMSASDLYVLHSAGEAFPNTLVQAMACGCVCITTDVGDAARIIVRSDRVVRPGDILAMAEKIDSILEIDETTLWQEGVDNRNKVIERFCIDFVIAQYEKCLLETL